MPTLDHLRLFAFSSLTLFVVLFFCFCLFFFPFLKIRSEISFSMQTLLFDTDLIQSNVHTIELQYERHRARYVPHDSGAPVSDASWRRRASTFVQDVRVEKHALCNMSDCAAHVRAFRARSQESADRTPCCAPPEDCRLQTLQTKPTLVTMVARRPTSPSTGREQPRRQDESAQSATQTIETTNQSIDHQSIHKHQFR
jgi:hypothetical protein